MRPLLLTLALVLLAPAAHAQRPDPNQPEGENLQTPLSWVVRFDEGHSAHAAPTVGADSTADVFFVNMTPGWHITTGPAGIFYHPESTAEGTYRAETLLHLFDPEGRNEAFGLFIGGQDLDGDALTYDYFLLRNSGEFLIKRRTADETTTLHPWTPHDAIATFGEDTESSAPNTLAVEVSEEEVVFLINDVEAARLPRAEVQTDGVVGLRINHALNVHVENLAVTEL
ncbi:MAG: hypothetical protein R3181_03400 [Rubricoccaceae bacterium]|nr:hypothetical protein [Rubricoccaceae bacterium]